MMFCLLFPILHFIAQHTTFNFTRRVRFHFANFAYGRCLSLSIVEQQWWFFISCSCILWNYFYLQSCIYNGQYCNHFRLQSKDKLCFHLSWNTNVTFGKRAVILVRSGRGNQIAACRAELTLVLQPMRIEIPPTYTGCLNSHYAHQCLFFFPDFLPIFGLGILVLTKSPI